MKAPDKIFKHLTTGNRLLNGKYYEYKPARIRYDDEIIEYIRKDALLEWAKEHQEGERQGSYTWSCYQIFIDKLNEM